jgi:hypothetical protein
MQIFHVLLLLVVLLLLNELFRKSRISTIVFFCILPVILTFAIWIDNGTRPGSSINTWFHWAKLYSVIAAVIGFTVMRYTKLGANKYMKFFPVLILGINISEAVMRDFQLGMLNGGIWHYFNAVAGILSIITLSGWSGIFIGKDNNKDLLWYDMTVFWIIAYDVWNFTYIYLCVPEHAAFGIAVLLACTIPSIFIKKGTWIQARAFTLAVWMMYVFTFPDFVDNASKNMVFSNNPTVLTIVGSVSLLLNASFAWVHFSKMYKKRAFKFGQEIHNED